MNCYVTNPYAGAAYPVFLNKDNTLFYPESGMTTKQMHKTARPKDYHIVTDCHLLVPLYSRHEVFLWDGKEWTNPDFQTYGASYNIILSQIFGIDCSIPRAVLDGQTTNVMGYSFNLKQQ